MNESLRLFELNKMQPLIASFEIFCSKYKRTEKRDVQKHENQMLNFGLIDKVKGGLISESFYFGCLILTIFSSCGS